MKSFTMNSNQEIATEASVHQLLENFKEYTNIKRNKKSKFRRGPVWKQLVATVSRFGNTLDNSITWLNKFEELYEYKKKYGNCDVPDDKSGEHKILARWVRNQRNNAFISEERKQMLDAIGFRWMIQNSSWHEHFEALKRYQFVHKRSHEKEGQNSCDTKIETVERNKVSPGQEATKEEILEEVTCTKSRIETTNEREVELKKVVDSCRDNYKLFVPTRDERKHEKSESEIRNVGRPDQEYVWNRQQNEQQIDIVVGKEGEIKHKNDNVVGEYKTYNLTNEPNKERIENELYSEQEERYCGQHMEQITVDANLEEAHQKETASERRVEMEHERNLKEKVQVLCKLSIMFRKEKNAVYSSIKKRKIDNSLTLNDSKRHRK